MEIHTVKVECPEFSVSSVIAPVESALGQGADDESSRCLLASIDADMPRWSAS